MSVLSALSPFLIGWKKTHWQWFLWPNYLAYLLFVQKIFYFYVHQEYLIAEECYADEWGWWSTNVGLSVVKVGKLKCYCNALVYFQSGALSCQTYVKMTNELSIEPFILIYDFFRRWTPRRKLLAADPVKLQSASCSLTGWFTVRERYLPTEIQEKSVMWMENLSECWSC